MTTIPFVGYFLLRDGSPPSSSLLIETVDIATDGGLVEFWGGYDNPGG